MCIFTLFKTMRLACSSLCKIYELAMNEPKIRSESSIKAILSKSSHSVYQFTSFKFIMLSNDIKSRKILLAFILDKIIFIYINIFL